MGNRTSEVGCGREMILYDMLEMRRWRVGDGSWEGIAFCMFQSSRYRMSGRERGKQQEICGWKVKHVS